MEQHPHYPILSLRFVPHISATLSILVAIAMFATMPLKAQEATEGPITVTILKSTGTFTASNANNTWHSVWESTVLPGFTMSTSANNMTTADDNIVGHSGQSNTSTYTITAPEGYLVSAYSFNFIQTTNDNTEKLTVNGTDYTATSTAKNIAITISKPVRTVNFIQSGKNKGITFSNFTVTLIKDTREPEPYVEIFTTLPENTSIPYRIPAIATRKNGEIVAVADYRHSRADIGMATDGRIDLHARISNDNGKTWGEKFSIIDGRGAAGKDTENQMYVAFGDPCIVADRESDSLLVISCSGNVSFPNGQRNNHQGIAHFYSTDGVNWSEPVDRSESIYSQFDQSPYGPVRAMFVGSGKISQSKYIKIKDFYRIYCAVLIKDVNGTNVNFALYSDDFGVNWKVLGGPDVSPIPSGGDEPKADELPDGSVVISSRTSGGRIYNIFSYTDAKNAEGVWGTSKYSNASNSGTVAQSNSTNGEILFVPVKRKADEKELYLALQSVPLGPDRANVGIYYKELETLADFVNPESFAANWDGCHQASYIRGAYSTMTLQNDNNIGFLYEENTHNAESSRSGYTIIYKNYSIEHITGDAYTYHAGVDHKEIVLAGIDTKTKELTPLPYVGGISQETVNNIQTAIDAYKANPSYETYETINSTIKDCKGLEVIPNAWYRLRNAERSNATLYIKPEASRLTAGVSNTENADQLFSFVPTEEEGKYYLYNGNYEYYLGPLGADETQPNITTSTTEAGVWSLITRPTGKSSLVCQNKTGSHTGLHLAGDNTRLVPWTNEAEASLWYIEPVDEFALNINDFIAVNMPFAMELPEEVTAFVAGEVETDASGIEYVKLYEYNSKAIAKCTPIILAATRGEYNIKVILKAEAAPANDLKGVLKSTTVSETGVYVLNGTDFTKYSLTLPANAGYYASDSNASSLKVKICDEETTINSINKAEAVKFYDLKGNEVEKPSRGIYVTSEGKKVLVL